MPRKQKKYHFTYKTTNTKTGRYYYGMHSTDNLEDGYLGSGKRLKYSIRKYGKDVHSREILEFFENRSTLIEAEKLIITLDEIAKRDCMNISKGGCGGFRSESHRRKFIESARNNDSLLNGRRTQKMLRESDPSWELARRQSISKALMGRRATFKGKKHSDETKVKMSESHKGKQTRNNNSQFGTKWITNGDDNKKLSKDTKLPNGWRFGRI